MTTSDLSDQQRAILLHVADLYDSDVWTDHGRTMIGHWGVSIRLTADADPSTRASMSRALRRLEQRGLVRRRNWHSGDRHQVGIEPVPTGPVRTTSVQLTDAGWEVVNKLRAVELLTVDAEWVVVKQRAICQLLTGTES